MSRSIPLAVHVLRGEGAFAQVQADWRRLHEALRTNDLATLPGIARVLAGALSDRDGPPLVVRVSRGADVVALALARLVAGRLGPLRLALLQLAHDHHLSFSDLIVAPDVPIEDVWRALVNELPRHGLRWQALRAPVAVDDAAIVRLMSLLPRQARHRQPVGNVAAANGWNVTLPYERHAAGFSETLRRNLALGWRRLGRSGNWTVRSIAGSDQQAEWALAQLIAIEDSSWKGVAGSSIASNPRLRAFVSDLYREPLSSRSRSEIHLLELNGAVLAAQFCVVVGRHRHMIKMGFDARFKRLNPGHLLMDELLRQACGDATLDRVELLGSQAWQEAWGAQPWPTHDVLLFRSRWTASLWRLSQWLRGRRPEVNPLAPAD